MGCNLRFGLPGDGAECFLRHSEIDPLHREQLLILLYQCVLGLGQMSLSEALSRSSSVAMTGRRPTNSGIRPYLSRPSGSTVAEDLTLLSILGRDDLGAEADRARPAARHPARPAR